MEKVRRREERRQDREERRRLQKLEAKRRDEEQKMQQRIAVEERKILIAQRKLETIRLLSELFARIKVSAAFSRLFAEVTRFCVIKTYGWLFIYLLCKSYQGTRNIMQRKHKKKEKNNNNNKKHTKNTSHGANIVQNSSYI